MPIQLSILFEFINNLKRKIVQETNRFVLVPHDVIYFLFIFQDCRFRFRRELSKILDRAYYILYLKVVKIHFFISVQKVRGLFGPWLIRT